MGGYSQPSFLLPLYIARPAITFDQVFIGNQNDVVDELTAVRIPIEGITVKWSHNFLGFADEGEVGKGNIGFREQRKIEQ